MTTVLYLVEKIHLGIIMDDMYRIIPRALRGLEVPNQLQGFILPVYISLNPQQL